MLKANFDVSMPQAESAPENERAAFRKRALENISGSMVFVEDELLWWDCDDE